MRGHFLLILFILLQVTQLLAQTKTDSLRLLLVAENNAKVKCQLLNELALELRSKDLESAKAASREAYVISMENAYLKEEGISRSMLGLLYSYTDNLIDSAVYWNTSAIPFLLPSGDSLEIARNYNRLGANYLLLKKQALAKKYILEALRWATTPKIKSSAYNNLGMISKQQGDYADAVAFYLGALQQQNYLNEPLSKARTLGNLGALYIQKKDYKKAKAMFEESYPICLAQGDPEILGQALSGLAVTETHLGTRTKAISLFTEAANTFKNGGYMSDYCQQITSIAGLQSEAGLYSLALKNYREAEKILLEKDDKPNLCLLYNNLAECYLSMKKEKLAVLNLEKAYALSKTFKDVNYNRLVVKNLSDIYENLGEAEKALQYRKIYEKLNDEMVNVAENVKYAELNHAFETSKKEAKIQKQDLQITQMESSRKYTYILMGALSLVVFLILLLYQKRVKNQRLLEENITSIGKQISSLKNENSELKSNLEKTGEELRKLEMKYSSIKEKLPENLIPLSKREYEVMLFIAEGLSDKEIAEKIFVSINTVRTHIRRIYDKLFVNSRTEAISMMNRYQLISDN